MKLKEIGLHLQLINSIKISSLPIEDIKNLLQLERSLQEARKEGEGIQMKVLNSHEVEPDQKGNYSWGDREDGPEIQEKMNELMEQEFEVKPRNFVAEETLYKASSDLNISQVSLLIDLLGKKSS